MVPWKMCEDNTCKSRKYQAVQMPFLQHKEVQALTDSNAFEGSTSLLLTDVVPKHDSFFFYCFKKKVLRFHLGITVLI
jgi:hypothetical protein